jgi:hypothetical protein
MTQLSTLTQERGRHHPIDDIKPSTVLECELLRIACPGIALVCKEMQVLLLNYLLPRLLLMHLTGSKM